MTAKVLIDTVTTTGGERVDRRVFVADLMSRVPAETLVVTGLGSPSYDVFAAGHRASTFHLWGAMGGAVPLGLGVALAQPEVPVLVVTSDGEQLMGIGSLATVAVQAPNNLTVGLAGQLEERVQVLVAEASDLPEAYVIFETLNDRGADLTTADLLKNYLFSSAKDYFHFVESRWSQLEADFDRAEDLVKFIRYDHASRHGSVSGRHLYRAIQAQVGGQRKAAKAYIESLLGAQEVYLAIRDPEHSYWGDVDVDVRDSLYAYRRFGFEAIAELLRPGPRSMVGSQSTGQNLPTRGFPDDPQHLRLWARLILIERPFNVKRSDGGASSRNPTLVMRRVTIRIREAGLATRPHGSSCEARTAEPSSRTFISRVAPRSCAAEASPDSGLFIRQAGISGGDDRRPRRARPQSNTAAPAHVDGVVTANDIVGSDRGRLPAAVMNRYLGARARGEI